jgi:hypothetical protein
MKKGLLISLCVIAAVVVMIWLSLPSANFRVEVCMEFEGRSACRIARGATEQQALRTASDNACALIASGMTASMSCGRREPKSVRWLDKP